MGQPSGLRSLITGSDPGTLPLISGLSLSPGSPTPRGTVDAEKSVCPALWLHAELQFLIPMTHNNPWILHSPL